MASESIVHSAEPLIRDRGIIVTELSTEDGTITDKQEFAEKKNDALINLIPRITCGVQTATSFAESKRLSLNFGHENRGKQKFEVPPITETRMLTSKTIGGGGLSANTSKWAAPVLASPFCCLMNISILTGSFSFDMENCSCPAPCFRVLCT